jgi:hypothetical protein
MSPLFKGTPRAVPDTRGVLVGHIHLDKNTFSILFQRGTIAILFLTFFLIVTVYIYMQII